MARGLAFVEQELLELDKKEKILKKKQDRSKTTHINLEFENGDFNSFSTKSKSRNEK